MRFPKIILSLFYVLLAIQPVFSQQVISGYYIDTLGQRKESTFKFKFDQEDYEQFVVISEGQERELTPKSVQEVGFENGRLFRSEILPESSNKVFVLLLREGEVDLLKWQKKYFIRNGEQIVALRELNSSKVVNGQEINVTTKQYQGILMSVLKPSPDQENLSRLIRNSSLNDRDLTDIVDLFHEVNGLAIVTKTITNQATAFGIGWKVQAGVGFHGLMENFENQGFSYSFKSGISPYFEVGARFRDFKNAPRLMVDLGVGYYAESDEILVSGSQVSFDLEGKQSYTSSSVVLPFQIHYIFSRENSSEWYGGAGLTFWISNFENNSAEVILDNGEPNLITHTDNFVERKPGSVSPNLKIGWSKGLSEKSDFFIEAKGDYLIKNYEMFPLTYYSVFNLGVLTLTAGISF
ncbi:hypothetical protein [Algoriphagus sp. A40]|uniref:hypothetical protein n=1 Tax=Algoriphagus sp. A40 TaxID=1945863 RepID=UPI000986EAA0|nr:hypothetical protein [Algoriphagus sp. A40]OOG76143.1 hypothetical protein B0E43_08840 [Algoriphagus sp. A40]